MDFIDLLFSLSFYLFPVGVIYSSHTCITPVNQLTIYNVLLASFFVLAYSGAFPMYFLLDELYHGVGHYDKNTVWELFLMSCYSILAFIVFYALTDRFLKKNRSRKSNKDIDVRNKTVDLQNWQLILLSLIVVLSVCVLTIYIMKIDKIAIFVAIQKGASAAAEYRSSMGNSFPGRYYIYSFFIHDVLNLVSWLLFAYFLQKKRASIFFIWLIMAMLSGFTAIMSTEKAPIVIVIVGYVLVYYLMRKNAVVPFSHIGLIFGFALVLVSIVYTVIGYGGSEDFFSSIQAALLRVVVGELDGAYQYLLLFPEQWSFLGGRSLPNPGGFLPYETFNLPVRVANHIWPHLESSKIVGSIVAVYWAEMYVNFSYIGLALIAPLIGVYIRIVELLVNKINSMYVFAGVMVWCILHFRTLSGAGIGQFMYDQDFIGIMIIGYLLDRIYKVENLRNLMTVGSSKQN